MQESKPIKLKRGVRCPLCGHIKPPKREVSDSALKANRLNLKKANEAKRKKREERLKNSRNFA